MENDLFPFGSEVINLRAEPREERIRLLVVLTHAWFRDRKRGIKHLPPLGKIAENLLDLTRLDVKNAKARVTREIGYDITQSRSKEMVRFKVLPPAA